MRKLDGNDLSAVATSLQTRGDVVAAYCFGSQTRRAATCPRDVDIAILGRHALDLGEILDMRRALSILLRTDKLDLVDLRRAGPALKRNIVAGGIRLFCRDDHAANGFELQAISEYHDSAARRRTQMQYLREEMALA